MASKDRSYVHMKSDLMRQINDDLNILIAEVHTELSRGDGPSPVLTGFFASSWKASTRQPRPRDRKEGTQWDLPTTKNSKGEIVLKGVSPIFAPRYPVGRERFKIDQRIFIGNTVEYAAITLGPPGPPNFGSRKNKIPIFVQGTLKSLINETFTDKKPKLRISSGQRRGFFEDLRVQYEPRFNRRVETTDPLN